MPSLEYWYYFPSSTKYKREEFQIERSFRGFTMSKKPGIGSCQALPVKNETFLPALLYFFKCLFPWWKPIMGIWKTAIKDLSKWVKQETTYFISDPKHCLPLQMTQTKLTPRFTNSVNNTTTHIKLLHNKIWYKSTQC